MLRAMTKHETRALAVALLLPFRVAAQPNVVLIVADDLGPFKAGRVQQRPHVVYQVPVGVVPPAGRPRAG